MIILTIRTDKPEAEIGLYDGEKKIKYHKWLADRKLSETILLKIDELLASADKAIEDIGGIVVFAGPGSFTGLRIGVTVANTLAYSLDVPTEGSRGDNWLQESILQLRTGSMAPGLVIPEYGSPAKTTKPSK